MSSPYSKKSILSYIEAHLSVIGVLVFIIMFALLVRLYDLGSPSGYYFDEVYHAMTVKLIAKNDSRAFEWTHGESIEVGTYVEWLHPPLAKYAQAFGVLVLGETGFGWRLSNALVGVGVIILVGLLSWQLFRDSRIAVLAMGLTSLETLLLVESRLATNDIFVTFFILVTIIVYVWYRHYPTYQRLLVVGLMAGLAMSSKWSGVFILLWVITVECLTLGVMQIGRARNQHLQVFPIVYGFLARVIALVVLPLFVYVASYWLMFAQGKDFAYFLELHSQIIAYQTSLEASHPYESRPWQWFINSKPVWYLVEYGQGDLRRDIYAIGNPALFLGGAVAVIYASCWFVIYVLRNIRQIARSLVAPGISSKKLLLRPLPEIPFWLGLGLITLAYWSVWVLWFFSPRIMFFYHYLPAVPVMIVIIAMLLVRSWDSLNDSTPKKHATILKVGIVLFIFSVLLSFTWLLPQVMALTVPLWWKNSLFLFGLWQ